jgi:hypothetical protein
MALRFVVEMAVELTRVKKETRSRRMECLESIVAASGVVVVVEESLKEGKFIRFYRNVFFQNRAVNYFASAGK